MVAISCSLRSDWSLGFRVRCKVWSRMSSKMSVLSSALYSVVGKECGYIGRLSINNLIRLHHNLHSHNSDYIYMESSGGQGEQSMKCATDVCEQWAMIGWLFDTSRMKWCACCQSLASNYAQRWWWLACSEWDRVHRMCQWHVHRWCTSCWCMMVQVVHLNMWAVIMHWWSVTCSRHFSPSSLSVVYSQMVDTNREAWPQQWGHPKSIDR